LDRELPSWPLNLRKARADRYGRVNKNLQGGHAFGVRTR
jgi:hypothetical protein